MLIIYLFYIVPASIFFPLIAAIINYRLLSKPLKVLFYFLLFSGSTNLVNIICSKHHMHTIQLFNVYVIFEFAFISFMYYYLLEGRWRKAIIPVIAVFAVLCVFDFGFWEPGLMMSSYTRSLEAVIIVGYSMLYLNQQSSKNIENNWGSDSLNWINIGILAYYASTVFMFAFENYLNKISLALSAMVWGIHDTFMIFEYILFGIGFYKCRK